MSHDDQIILVGSFISLVFFLAAQGVVFRFLKAEQLLKTIMIMAVVAGIVDAVLVWGWTKDLSVLQAMALMGLSLVILGLALFVYVLCIFGPYETSIRMRLIREIAQGGSSGCWPQDIARAYNAQVMLDNRLKRLMGSGDVVAQNGLYRIGKHHNAFFVIDRIARGINRFIKNNA